eukprot:scaffold4350_cov66-Phaeocystis_antarctica.AAC.2
MVPAARFHQRKGLPPLALLVLVAGRFIRKGSSLSFVEGVCVVNGCVIHSVSYTSVNVHESRVKRVKRSVGASQTAERVERGGEVLRLIAALFLIFHHLLRLVHTLRWLVGGG